MAVAASLAAHFAVRAYLGDRALLARDFAAAQKQYEATLRNRPNSPAALNNLAWAAHHLGRNDAVGYAERAVRMRPSEPSFADTLGRLQAVAGQWQPAIRSQARAVALAPHVPAYGINLARARWRSCAGCSDRPQVPFIPRHLEPAQSARAPVPVNLPPKGATS